MPRNAIHAPMACSVVEVMVANGQVVRAGQPLLIVEAMKMEHEICAEADALVVAIQVQAGESVAEGELLVRLGAPQASASPRGEQAAPPSQISTSAPTVRADLAEVQ